MQRRALSEPRNMPDVFAVSDCVLIGRLHTARYLVNDGDKQHVHCVITTGIV